MFFHSNRVPKSTTRVCARTVLEIEESAALDRLKASFRDAARVGFLSDVPSYDVRDNPAYFFAFGEPRPRAPPTEAVPPDPGLPERALALPESVLNTDGDVMHDVATLNSQDTLHAQMLDAAANRAKVWGTDLTLAQAVVLGPREKPVFFEGRVGVVFKPVDRVHVQEVGDEVIDADARDDEWQPPRRDE